jgi:glycosyltransferase involved in cell wall biosynthesis
MVLGKGYEATVRKVLLYSPVTRRRLFSLMRFYRSDICAMRAQGCQVLLANSLWRVVSADYDSLVGYFYTWSVIAAMLAKLRGREAVLTGGADQFSGCVHVGRLSVLARRALLAIAVVVCDRLVLVSQNDVCNVTKAAGPFGRIAASKIVVAGHPIDEPSGLPRRFSDKTWQAVTICWMGSEGNVVRKGLIAAVELIAELRRLGDDLPLLVIGTPGPGTRLLSEAVQAAGVASQVRIVGAATDARKWQLLAQSAVYFQLSQYEGFGVAALEALRCGCVVVHTGNGALEETIGRDGMRVDVSSLRQLAPTFREAVTSKLACLSAESERILGGIVQRFSPERRARALLLDRTG